MPWTEEPGGLQSMRSQRVEHDCGTNFPFLMGSLSLTKEAKICNGEKIVSSTSGAGKTD